eukprot:Nk52_evm32s2496 gene=Nk52_evmTU32s2496
MTIHAVIANPCEEASQHASASQDADVSSKPASKNISETRFAAGGEDPYDNPAEYLESTVLRRKKEGGESPEEQMDGQTTGVVQKEEDDDSGGEQALESSRPVEGYQKIYFVENGFSVLTAKLKEDIKTCRELIMYFKKKMAVEDEYARSAGKATRNFIESVGKDSDFKQGTFLEGCMCLLHSSEKMAQSRQNFVQSVTENVIEKLSLLLKDMEKNRKQVKDAGVKHKKMLSDSIASLNKAKHKYQQHTQEWEKAILDKNRMENAPVSSNKKGKSASQTAKCVKHEEDMRSKALVAEDNYREQLNLTNKEQHDYYSLHLPYVIKMGTTLGSNSDENLKRYLMEYAMLLSNVGLRDVDLLKTTKYEKGVMDSLQSIDNVQDFSLYVKNATKDMPEINHEPFDFEPYRLSEEAAWIVNPQPVFGIQLSEQQISGKGKPLIPTFLQRCCEYIEENINEEGLYRVPGITSAIKDLKFSIDRDPNNVDFSKFDIYAVAAVLKQFFRDLPEPLMQYGLYSEWIAAVKPVLEEEQLEGSCSSDCLKQCISKLRSLWKQLPVSAQAVLKYTMKHLNTVASASAQNRMDSHNLSLVFGPNLLRSGGDFNPSKALGESANKCFIIEVLIDNFHAIFE